MKSPKVIPPVRSLIKDHDDASSYLLTYPVDRLMGIRISGTVYLIRLKFSFQDDKIGEDSEVRRLFSR